jgi:formaldehyde-activating enzyme involved in methanogenesis
MTVSRAIVGRGRIARESGLDIGGQDFPDGREFAQELADQVMGHGPRVGLGR